MVIKKHVFCSLFVCLLLIFCSCELIFEDLSETNETWIAAETSGLDAEEPTETETETPTEATPQETIPPELRPKPNPMMGMSYRPMRLRSALP